ALYRLRVGSPGSGYILSSACSVSPRVPPENLTVLVEASEQFARQTHCWRLWRFLGCRRFF
ncbi:MAG: hypothetical protein RMI90_14550, partial [Thermoguttaceae bacterium]|nr:hypothetical protein [Thermoguttaceae bacterium]